MAITFAELLNFLKTLTPEQLRNTATLYDTYQDEFFAITNLKIVNDQNETDPGNGVLHHDHPYITFKE